MRDSLGARHALLSPPPYFFLIIFIISRSRRSKKPSRIQRRRRTAAAPRSLLNYNNKVECNGYLARRSSLTIKLADRWGIKTDEFEIKMLFRYKCAFLTFPVRIWQWNFVHGTTLHPLPFASRKSLVYFFSFWLCHNESGLRGKTDGGECFQKKRPLNNSRSWCRGSMGPSFGAGRGVLFSQSATIGQ